MENEEIIKTKVCNKCGRELPMTTEYYSHDKDKKDGFRTICKKCTSTKEIKDYTGLSELEIWYEDRTKPFKNRWSYESIKWLKENFENKSKKEIELYFNNEVNYSSICTVASKMKLKKDNSVTWSKEDTQLLLRVYAYYLNEEIVEMFLPNMSIGNIRSKINRYNKDNKVSLYKSQETLDRTSKLRGERNTGENSSNFGMIVSAETRKKLSENKKKFFKDKTNHPFYGKHLTDEHKRNISKGRRGTKEKTDKNILQVYDYNQNDEIDLLDTVGGIYKILNLVNGKFYIGSSNNLYSRSYGHIADLHEGKHHSIHLQRAWNKYGEKNFVFLVMEYVKDDNKLREIEQVWLDKTKCYDMNIGYNISINANGGMIGRKHSAKTKKKLSEMGKGRPKSEETKQRMRNYHQSHKRVKSAEEIKKLSKQIDQYDIEDNFIKAWSSITEASEELNINRTTIGECCGHIINTAGGFRWTFKGKKIFKNKDNRNTSILQYKKSNDKKILIKEWVSMNSLYKELHISSEKIKKCCDNKIEYKGYLWEYKEAS